MISETQKVNATISVSGKQGPQGPQGPQGEPGEGVVAGGTTGQVLVKKSNTDYDTEWATPSAAAGVNTFNGRSGDVTPASGDYSLSQVTEDSTHRVVTDTEKSTWNAKQDELVSGTSIKTINNESILGSGNITVGAVDSINGETGTVVLDGSDINVDETAATKVSVKDAIESKVDKVEGKGLSTNDYTDLDEARLAAAFQVKHYHPNTSILNTYTQTEANLADAVSKKHSHSNKSVIDGIDSADVSSWDAKQEALVSGTNIKTINNQSILGSGNITISGTGAVDSVNGKTGVVVLDGADINIDESAATKETLKAAINKKANSSDIPTKTSQLTNDSGFLTEHQSLAAYRTSAAQDIIDAEFAKSDDLATVATSGSYNDLSNKPTIPEEYVLPTASTTTLGGVKVDGSSITITDGVISSSGGSGEEAFKVTISKEDAGYVSDKTNAEIYAAYTAGKRVYLHMSHENTLLQAINITSTLAQFGVIYGYNNNQEVWTDVLSIENDVISAELYTLVTTVDLNNYRTAAAQNAIDITKANIADLATVATSGSYNDLSDKPSEYVLPTASTSTLGGVKVDGSTITIEDGVISSSGGSSYTFTNGLTESEGTVSWDLNDRIKAGTGDSSVSIVNNTVNGTITNSGKGQLIIGELNSASNKIIASSSAALINAELFNGATVQVTSRACLANVYANSGTISLANYGVFLGGYKTKGGTTQIAGPGSIGYVYDVNGNSMILGIASQGFGEGVLAKSKNQMVSGKCNVGDSASAYLRIIGNGSDENNRSNAYALDWSGNERIAGDIYVGCSSDSTGGTKLLRQTLNATETSPSIDDQINWTYE